jgi:hypothetical protein
MTLVNPTPIITQLAAQLLLSPTVIAKGFTTDADIWYPNLSLKAATFPALLLVETPQKRTRYAEGALPLISGTLKIIYYEAGTDPGSLENFARSLCIDLGSQYYGICFRDYEVGLCSDPKPGQRAVADGKPNADYRQITTTVQYGLTR